MGNDGEFRCAACGGVFDKGWSDDEAAAELGRAFPGFTTDDCDLVCDDCYDRMIGRRASAT
jgi:hypothetical protein